MTAQPSSETYGEDAYSVMDERPHLLNLSYRMLGSLAEAEDAVQEAYARWYALCPRERDEIRKPGAWLTTVTSRICLNVLTSARARRERYVGAWLPEPLPEPAELAAAPGRVDDDPVDRVTLDESVGMALMVVMESLTPPERVAFILHDVFRYPFVEIADMVGRSPGACRQLASSARRRVRASRAETTTASMSNADVVRRFRRAWEAKDIGALVTLLDPNVVATADGGGRALTFFEPIVGREQVAQAWLRLADRVVDLIMLERTVNGQPGIVAQHDGRTVSVYAFDVVEDRIRNIWVVRNPDKLTAWSA